MLRKLQRKFRKRKIEIEKCFACTLIKFNWSMVQCRQELEEQCKYKERKVRWLKHLRKSVFFMSKLSNTGTRLKAGFFLGSS